MSLKAENASVVDKNIQFEIEPGLNANTNNSDNDSRNAMNSNGEQIGISLTSSSMVLGTGAGGVGAVGGINGTNSAGVITLTAGAAPASAAVIATITFKTPLGTIPYSTAPAVVIGPGNANTAGAGVYATSTTTGFVLRSGATPLVAGTSYSWYYTVTNTSNTVNLIFSINGQNYTLEAVMI